MAAARATPRSARPSDGKLPMLPGYASKMPLGKPIRQTLGFHVGSGPIVDISRGGFDGLPAIDMGDIQRQQASALMSARSTVTHEERRSARDSARSTYRPNIEPEWLKNDKKVLRFYAYFRESVHEDSREINRVRKCTICYYLEDGTMMVLEPRSRNSGIPQGTFIKRHKVPLPTSGFYSIKNLGTRVTLSIYSRSFRIYDCDAFTRQYFEQNGMELAPPEELPDQLRALEHAMTPRTPDPARVQENIEIQRYYDSLFGGGKKNAGLQQYLEKDRMVLRFRCVWDDNSQYGVRNHYTLHYYLHDDTVEVIEMMKSNTGRLPWPVFFKRDMLTKNPHFNPAPGMVKPAPQYYGIEDLEVGGSVIVYNRELILYDCDEFTRRHYQEEHGIEQGSIDVSEPEEPKVEPPPPPNIGVGSEEDSLANCKALRPKPPRKDINKLLLDSDKELRFEASMVTNIREYKPRLFRIICFIADETVAVDEITGNNSGFFNGKFTSRSRIKNPLTGQWFKPSEFFLGATLQINSIQFRLTRADERTLVYMERNCDIHRVSDVIAVASKIVPLVEHLAESYDAIAAQELQGLAETQFGVQLAEHEVVTLVRNCGSPALGESPASINLERVLLLLR